jgi:hypothetical protein
LRLKVKAYTTPCVGRAVYIAYSASLPLKPVDECTQAPWLLLYVLPSLSHEVNKKILTFSRSSHLRKTRIPKMSTCLP